MHPHTKYSFIFTLVILLVLGSCAVLLGPNIKPGVELFAAGDYSGALKHYETIIEADQANAKVYRLAYESAFKSGKRVTAAKYYKSALEVGYAADSLRSLATDLWYDRALMVMGRNDWKAARKAAEQIAWLAPDSQKDKFCANILAGKKKYDRGAHKGLWDAILDYNKAANYDPSSGLPHFLMGQARYKNDRNDFDAALEDYYQAVKIEPNGYFSDRARADIKKIEAIKKKMKAFWGK
ncbi:MAG: hypothetical protein U9Q77_05060 [Candidatus Marinimicrobia bacterium]|nr:hypothetical protein [Candidatus Neomarinimicrobiota bacterium]